MKSPLPQRGSMSAPPVSPACFAQAFEDALFLPFNRTSLAGRFELAAAPAPVIAGGVWLVLQGAQLYLTAAGDLPEGLQPPATAECCLCGWWQQRPCVLCRWPQEASSPIGLVGHSLQAEDPGISLALLSLAALGRQLLHWLGNSRCCSACGTPLQALAHSWGRRCSGCAREHYPHIHPCIIVLVQRGEQILLTRKAGWKAGRYSLVAGFVDVGECLEETVVREVREETGIAITNLRYVGSQGWPFPSQLMVGFTADYAGGDIQVEEAELEDARWFSCHDLPLLPGRRSISRFLIDRHLKQLGVLP